MVKSHSFIYLFFEYICLILSYHILIYSYLKFIFLIKIFREHSFWNTPNKIIISYLSFLTYISLFNFLLKFFLLIVFGKLEKSRVPDWRSKSTEEKHMSHVRINQWIALFRTPPCFSTLPFSPYITHESRPRFNLRSKRKKNCKRLRKKDAFKILNHPSKPIKNRAVSSLPPSGFLQGGILCKTQTPVQARCPVSGW